MGIINSAILNSSINNYDFYESEYSKYESPRMETKLKKTKDMSSWSTDIEQYNKRLCPDDYHFYSFVLKTSLEICETEQLSNYNNLLNYNNSLNYNNLSNETSLLVMAYFLHHQTRDSELEIHKKLVNEFKIDDETAGNISNLVFFLNCNKSNHKKRINRLKFPFLDFVQDSLILYKMTPHGISKICTESKNVYDAKIKLEFVLTQQENLETSKALSLSIALCENLKKIITNI